VPLRSTYIKELGWNIYNNFKWELSTYREKQRKRDMSSPSRLKRSYKSLNPTTKSSADSVCPNWEGLKLTDIPTFYSTQDAR